MCSREIKLDKQPLCPSCGRPVICVEQGGRMTYRIECPPCGLSMVPQKTTREAVSALKQIKMRVNASEDRRRSIASDGIYGIAKRLA